MIVSVRKKICLTAVIATRAPSRRRDNRPAPLPKLSAAPITFGEFPNERALCESIADDLRGRGIPVHNFAGETTLTEYIELAAACRIYLTNDSGSMHIASALNVPTIAVFGATDHIGTGPTGPLARVVREQVECSPCLLRECPIDHRCMKAVTAERVVREANELTSLSQQ